MITVGEANRRRLCLDCGAPDAGLWAEGKRLLRICNACLRAGRWDAFKLREREPIPEEMSTDDSRLTAKGDDSDRAMLDSLDVIDTMKGGG